MTDRAVPLAFTGVVLLAAWLGAGLLVAAVVAPAAFAVLPSRTLAGALVGRVLPVVFGAGIAIGFSTAAFTWPISPRGGRTSAILVLVLACAIAQLGVAPRIQRVREQIGGAVDALDPSEARRRAFGRLHGLSVAFLGVGGIGAVVALTVLSRQLAARSMP